MRRTLALCAIVACVIDARVTGAQVALDLGAGYSRGLGGPRASDRNSLALSTVLATPARSGTDRGLILAVSASMDLSMGGTACLAVTGAPCAQFPSLFSIAVLAGWAQSADMSQGGRWLIGPAWVRNSDTEKAGLGMMARVDWAMQFAPHVSVALGAHGGIAPKWQNAHVGVVGASAGLRWHPRPSIPSRIHTIP